MTGEVLATCWCGEPVSLKTLLVEGVESRRIACDAHGTDWMLKPGST